MGTPKTSFKDIETIQEKLCYKTSHEKHVKKPAYN